MKNTTRCVHCNRELEPLILFGKVVRYRVCTCETAQNLLNAEIMRSERERLEQEKIERRKRYERAGIKPRFIYAIADCDVYVDSVLKGNGLYIFGDVGVGKTHLASAISRNLIDLGKSVRFVPSVEVYTALKETYSSRKTENEVFSKYCGCDVLVLDDLGKEAPTDWALSVLYRIINERYEKLLPVIVTTQFSSSELARRLSPQSDENALAVVSRLYGMCIGVPLGGDDKRLNERRSK